ncbi:MAG TPA: hypothetical protein PKW33_15470 [Anaerolineaceae bacterium]|nr:hypothetical protein [Anaerolineaceae bacterium]HPN52994.1 hypothetical protein [Anaerolineaceae bacterium]
MKRTSSGVPDLAGLDPYIADALEDGSRRQRQRTMTKEQRRQANRNRVTYDLPVELTDRLSAMADELDCPVSQVVRYLLENGIETVTLDEMVNKRTVSRSMRFEFVLYKDATKGRP